MEIDNGVDRQQQHTEQTMLSKTFLLSHLGATVTGPCKERLARTQAIGVV